MALNFRIDSSAGTSWPRLASLAGAAALIAGLAWWGLRLTEPLSRPPAAPVAAPAPGDNGAAEVAAWLAPGPARLDVQVAGMLAGGGLARRCCRSTAARRRPTRSATSSPVRRAWSASTRRR